jgi:hypothetical protein
MSDHTSVFPPNINPGVATAESLRPLTRPAPGGALDMMEDAVRKAVTHAFEKTPTPDTGAGRKNDHGKLPWHLLPIDAINAVLEVLEHGQRKYAARNWEAGMDWSRCYAALMRHLSAWWQFKDTDPETGLSHLAHAHACLLFLSAYEIRHIGRDDRP